MAIEFRCSTCNKLLRTPDEAAGKSARCPQCGTVVDVPSAAGADDPFGGSDPFAPDSTEQPAAEPEPAPFVDPSNPYAVSSPVQDPIKAAVTGGEFHHQQVDFDDLFSTPWSILKMNIGPIAICGLFMLAFNMAVGIVNQVLGMVMPPVVQSLEGDTFSIVMTVIMFQLGMNALSLVVQTWVQLGATNYLLQMMRTGRAQVGDYFSVGPCYLRAFLFQIVIMLITIGISLVCMAPAAIIFFATGGLFGFQDDPAPTIIAAIVGV
ncbi:MAG: hypothetical protein QGG36_32555, partial [Pirellulaceae bacterium]|nr:hypothetical protein [Pirellulaceae bacterium]